VDNLENITLCHIKKAHNKAVEEWRQQNDKMKKLAKDIKMKSRSKGAKSF
jgi:hypothetical protein